MQKLIIFILCMAQYVLAITEDIIVHNKSDFLVYAAIYNEKKEAIRYTPVKEIKPGESVAFELPPFKAFTYRELGFSLNEDDLKDILTEDQLRTIAKQNIGTAQGYNFYLIINPKEGELKGYNRVEWNILKPVQDKLNGAVKFLSKNTIGQLRRAATKDFEHVQEQAQVRVSTDISKSEKDFIELRLPRIKNALENMLGSDINYIPRVAFCGSGGGYRAMLSTLGFLKGADQIGLTDCALFAAGLSGSTWALAVWMSSGLPVQGVIDYLKLRLDKNFALALSNPGEFAKILLLKYSFNQPLSLVDMYGALLTRSLLGGMTNPYKLHLSNQKMRLENGNYVLPIYTAIATKQPYEWIEFTPFEIGSNYLNGYIPSWAFGRKFALGKSLDKAPEQPLGFLMGIWGSAFGINFKEILIHAGEGIKPDFLKRALETTFQETIIGRQRAFPAQVYNFMLGVPQSPRSKEVTLTLIDAGIDYNLPIPPLLRPERAVDIIIIFDASAGNVVGSELQKAREYFKKRNMPFPEFALEDLKNNICTVLKSEDSTAPVIIYMPLIKNKEYNDFDPANCPELFCDTFNFTYTSAQVDLLTGLTAFNMIQSKDIIVKTIKDVIELKG